MSAYSRHPLLKYVFQGEFADFSTKWFHDSRPIILTNLILNALDPIIVVVI